MSSRYAPPAGKLPQLTESQPPVKIVRVRAHTRAVPAKKPAPIERVPLPPSLSPKTDTRFTQPPAAPVKVAPVRATPVPSDTQYVLPATRHGASQRFYHPLHPGQKPSGYEAVGRRPGRAGIGSPVTSRPYWLATRGPAGDQGAQLTSAQLAAARQAGVPQTIPMAVLSSTVHPLTDLSRQAQGLRPFSVGGAASDVANIASALISPEKAGAAAGIFGLRGLWAARVAKEAVVAEDAAKAAKAVHVPGAAPEALPVHLSQTHYFNQYGQLSPVAWAERDRLTVHNIHDEHGNLIGSMTYDARPHQPKIYVESVFIRPEDRNLGNFRRLLAPVLDEQRPIDADISNPRLKAIFDRFVGKSGRGEPAKVPEGLPAIERGSAPMFPLPPKAFLGPVAEGPRPGVVKAAETAAAPEAQAAHATPVAAAVREALEGAPAVRRGQAAGFSAQRASKAAQVEKIYRDASLTPDEREAKANAVLKGELERPTYTGFQKLTPDAVTNLKSQIMGHDTLRTFQKKTLLNSLNRAVAGKVPTAGEQKLFEQTFGKSVSAGIIQAAKSGRWKNIATNVVNVPRTLQATADLSAFLRQGFVALGRHPIITGKNFIPMVKAYASEDVARGIEQEIAARPNFPLMRAAKVAFTGGADLSPHEEQFAAHMLEAIGGTKNPIRWSSRAYSTFLNKTRADVFDHLVGVAQAQGKNVHDEKFLKDLGEMVNVFTGRGGLPANLERAANVFNGLFFSPRLLNSRLKLLGQPFNLALARRNPFVYKQYLRAFTQSFGALATVLGLAKLNGLDVGTNPRSADFGKIKFGNTRVDLGAGFLQYFHLLGTLGTRQYKSSTSGKVYKLGGGYGQKSAYAVLDDFFGNKLSPPASAIRDLLKQQTNYGPYSPGQEATARLLPLVWQDVHDIYKEHGGGESRILPAAAGGGLAILGGGIQTYGPKSPKPSGPPDYAGGPGGGSPYAPPSGGGSPYAPP